MGMEMKEICRSFFKILFIAFNAIAALMGLIIVILGIVALATAKYLYVANLNWVSLPIFLILCGLILMAFTGTGVLGALCEFKFILIIYSFGLMTCAILLIIGSISGFIWKVDLENGVRDSLNGNLQANNYSSLVDDIQEHEQCCGVSNYTDWFGTPWTMNPINRASHKAVPESCCKNTKECSHGVDGKPINTEDIYTDGCYSKIANFIEDYYYGFIIVVFLFALFLFIGTGVSWYLVCTKASKSWFKKEKGYETV